MDFSFSIAGFLVGLLVGMSGVGGGSLMTPFLLFVGIAPAVAVGTDLLFAAITKSGGIFAYQRECLIRWRVVALLALGSLPATALTIGLLARLESLGFDYQLLITRTLSFSLLLTGVVLLASGHLHGLGKKSDFVAAAIAWRERWTGPLTVLAGLLLGALVTLSSVGAGALGAAILVTLYPRLPMRRVVAIDLAHAVPLTALAGLGHWQLGSVDFQLLGLLLLGSLPGIMLGSRVGRYLPEQVMRTLLGIILLIVGFSIL